MGLIDAERDWTDFPLWPDAHYCQAIPKARFDELIQEIAEWLYGYNNSPGIIYRRLKPKIISYLKSDPKALVRKGFYFTKKLLDRKR